MRILIAHNFYGDHVADGEGNVFKAEAEMLANQGHTVRTFSRTNAEVNSYSLIQKIKAFWNLSWSQDSYDKISKEIESFKPDIMHVHNYFFQLSPSIFKAAKDQGIPTVVSCHNYALATPCALYLRDGKPCEKCVNKNPWRLIWHRCYNNSLLRSIARYRTHYLSRKKNRWTDYIGGFIVLTKFGLQKHIESGLDPKRIFIKPNFIRDPLGKGEQIQSGNGAIFIGRLSNEKGIQTLIKSWETINYPLTIIGKGPLQQMVAEAGNKNINYLGQLSHKSIFEELRKSAFVVFPSICYEAFPLVILEGFAMGKPIVASNIGAMAEIIEDGKTGIHFRPGDADDLAAKVKSLIQTPEQITKMALAVRQEYQNKYTEQKNYEKHMEIYQSILGTNSASTNIVDNNLATVNC